MRVCACARVRVHVCEAPIAILTRSGAPEGLIVRLRFLFNPSGLAFGLLQKPHLICKNREKSCFGQNVEIFLKNREIG